ncbi:MAG: transglutaminase family protein [Betaproteobacteria bacterium]
MPSSFDVSTAPSPGDEPSPATLVPAAMVDADHPAVVAFAQQHATGADDRTRAVALYYAVRDGFRYDPYCVDLREQGMRASTVLAQGVGWCITKAALLSAACRAVGIPSRLGFADVRNHLSTERMRALMKTDEFVWHGYSEIWLGGAWRKATPAFNIELCTRFGLLALEFDGVADSIYHPFDSRGQRHMEYLREHGSFDDVPLQRIRADFARYYPGWGDPQGTLPSADFDADVAAETR